MQNLFVREMLLYYVGAPVTKGDEYVDLKETIRLCQLGDKDAFKSLFCSIEKKALATAYLISGTRGIAEDILQEAYIKCFEEIKKLKDPEAFNVWFYRILVRTGWRMAKKHSSIIPVNSSIASQDSIYDDKQNIENIVSESEMRYTVQKAINHLSHKLKVPVILYYFNDMTISEISKVQGCPKATVKSRLFYARNILKKGLSGFFEKDPDLIKVKGKECNENG